MIVAIGGLIGAGKNTAAGALIQRGFKPLAFADTLKAMALEINPTVINIVLDRQKVVTTLADLVVAVGWEEAKKVPGVRKFLQNFGCVVRDRLDPNAWVKALAAKLDLESDQDYVITDPRFENEGDFLDNLRYKTRVLNVWVENAQVTAQADTSHVSEKGQFFPYCDVIVPNNGTKQELWDQMIRLVEGKQ